MSNQIIITLKRKLDDMASQITLDAEVKRNAIKEELQLYVLNFIYHHPKYSEWIMYGGSSLRICHGLNRMSVDLDFETAQTINEKFLTTLEKEIGNYFFDNYGAEDDFLSIKITNGRGLTLKFHVGDELGLLQHSKQVHVKIDLNHFVAKNIVTERIPINSDQFSFVITVYNMSSLMASKIGAIFQRGTRGIGKDFYEEKGRDIYDLLWYMNKGIVPDLNYLAAKGVSVKDLRVLFDKLTIKMNSVSDANLKQDLTPLFADQTYIANWLKNWRESYLRLKDAYKIRTVFGLKDIIVEMNPNNDNFSFTYLYDTEDGVPVRIIYRISDDWISSKAGDLSVKINNKIVALASGNLDKPLSEKLKRYVTNFYEKTESYFKKTNRIMLGDNISTKLIRLTADNLNLNEQIVLNKSTLISSKLDDLLK
jgi:predicted nucleotidyltransferase component of viral defense system